MLHLRELSGLAPQTQRLFITDNLPSFLTAPCQVEATYQIENKIDFYLIRLQVKGNLTVICQRCLHEFETTYDNVTEIAVAASEEKANRLQEEYECIVSSKGQVVLEDLVRDDLHLYGPSSHEDSRDCDREVLKVLG